MIVRGQKEMMALAGFIMTLRRLDIMKAKLDQDFKEDGFTIEITATTEWMEWDHEQQRAVMRSVRK